MKKRKRTVEEKKIEIKTSLTQEDSQLDDYGASEMEMPEFRFSQSTVPPHTLSKEISEDPGWKGACNREEAERILSSAAPGTYLLREKDEWVADVEYNLHSSNSFPFHLYILTKVEAEDQLKEFVLIQRESGWAFYNDEPDLGKYRYRKLKSLLKTLRATTPAY